MNDLRPVVQHIFVNKYKRVQVGSGSGINWLPGSGSCGYYTTSQNGVILSIYQMVGQFLTRLSKHVAKQKGLHSFVGGISKIECLVLKLEPGGLLISSHGLINDPWFQHPVHIGLELCKCPTSGYSGDPRAWTK